MVFGTAISKIMSGSNELILSGSEMSPNFFIPNEIEHKSIITGKRNYVTVGDDSQFEVLVNLFKGYTTFDDIKTWKHKTVIFFPHADGNAVRNKIGYDCSFHITDIEPYYLTNIVDYDIAIIKLQSLENIRYIALTHYGYGFSYGVGYGFGL